MTLHLRPITVKAARRVNADLHRKLAKIQGAMWAVAVERGAPPPDRRRRSRREAFAHVG